ncbi:MULTISPECIES: phage head closure protein [Bacillus]|uniref:Head-tail adaptor protein n=2 Tax=Bacillus amyloliquefaciens group TaxID=1938374 RepID=A0AAI8HMK4_9BACI|nr:MULTISPECIES: phage head closure protein [Bacillus]AGF26913.1 phage head-tail adaptor [Bacillus amyloliquefaciens IT-45]AJH24047.1 phage head-tail adapter protein [Bacillus velezensis]AKD22249.1 phage head-tail adapter protein [Bacillus velezensis]AKF31556.1 phage head-tail adapter protein [Bacillus velezensis]AMP31048.1 phage head-tail adapter protein [Bacillus amyloliquefaciens]
MLNDMRYRIQFQKKKPGGRLPVEGNDSWETVIECWAKAEGLKGREYYAAAAIQKEKTVQFTIRHREDINEHMRIVFQGVPYEIEAILPNYSRRHFITIKANVVSR